MVFKPLPGRTRLEAIIAAIWIGLIEIGLIAWILNRPVDWLTFVLVMTMMASLIFLVQIVLRAWVIVKMEYWLDRNAVTIYTPLARQIIPIAAIERIIPGHLAQGRSQRWLNWPSPYRWTESPSGRAPFSMQATRPLADCLILDTGQDGAFAISPTDGEAFITALQERRSLGSTRVFSVHKENVSFCATGLGQSRLGTSLLAIGALGMILLFGLLTVQYPTLPDMLAFHYNRQGNPDLIQQKSFLFLIPVIGLLTWLINGLWGLWLACQSESKQPVSAYLLWGGAVTVQLFCLMALSSLLTR